MKPDEQVHGHADAEVSALLETLLKTGQRLEELTAGEVDTVADRDGRTFWLRGTQGQLRSSEDTREAVVLNNQKKLEAQNERLEVAVAARTHELAEANRRLTILDRSKNDFLRLISHEFRTPLNGILGVSELILSSMPPTEENIELQNLFERSRQRLILMLDDAMLLTRIDMRGDHLETAKVSLSVVLERAIEKATEFAESRNVTFTSLVGGSDFILGDEDLLTRALHALLETAVRFSEEGETVRVFVGSDSPSILIDSVGKAVSGASLAKLFEIFAVSEAETPGRDLGLGPALAYRILSLFGGSVSVATRDPSGIRLTVSLVKGSPQSG